MKDSGIPWIGEIPSHWRLFQTSTLFHEHKEKNNGLKEKNLLSLSYGQIKRKDINSSEGLLPQSFETYNIIDKGDIVFRLTDLQNDKRSLRTGLCKERGIITSAYVSVRANTEIDCRYFHYLYHTYDICKVFYGLGDGVRQGMNYDDLKKLLVFLPPIPEQQSIADCLDKKCSEIDEMVSLQEKIVEELKAYKQSVITETVCKGLNPDAPMKDSGIEWIGQIPTGWKAKRLKYLGYGENGLTYSPSVMCGEEGVLVLRSSNIQGSKLVFTDNVYVSCSIPEKLFVKKGDIIICSRNGSAALVGKCALVEDEINASFGAFMLRFRTSLNNRYAYYLLTGVISNYKQLFSTTTINQLTLSTFNNLYAPVATENKEQQVIADYLDTKCAEIDALISLKQSKIDALKEYKKSIIYEYITGKKEVVL